MSDIPYRYLNRASPPAFRLVVGRVETTNPIDKARKLKLPLDKMRVGESLMFNFAEMLPHQWKAARAMATRYNNEYGELFAFIKHTYGLEIVRIR